MLTPCYLSSPVHPIWKLWLIAIFRLPTIYPLMKRSRYWPQSRIGWLFVWGGGEPAHMYRMLQNWLRIPESSWPLSYSQEKSPAPPGSLVSVRGRKNFFSFHVRNKPGMSIFIIHIQAGVIYRKSERSNGLFHPHQPPPSDTIYAYRDDAQARIKSPLSSSIVTESQNSLVSARSSSRPLHMRDH